MQVLHRCCCGLDVHQRFVVACLIWYTQDGTQHKELQRFPTFTPDLLRLIEWLQAAGCTHVALESTGGYWKPIFNLMEGLFEIILVNAQHMKAVPGRKTDSKDAEWIAALRHARLPQAFFDPASAAARPARFDRALAAVSKRSAPAMAIASTSCWRKLTSNSAQSGLS